MSVVHQLALRPHSDSGSSTYYLLIVVVLLRCLCPQLDIGDPEELLLSAADGEDMLIVTFADVQRYGNFSICSSFCSSFVHSCVNFVVACVVACAVACVLACVVACVTGLPINIFANVQQCP